MVLFLHRVFARRDDLLPSEPSAESFSRMLGWLRSQFVMLPLSEGVARWADGTLPPNAAALSFDDGYRDNLEVALPVLREHGVPATVFVASAYLDGGLMWSDRVLEAVRAAGADHLDLPEIGLEHLPLKDWNDRRAASDRLLRQIKYRGQAERDRLVDLVVARCRAEDPPRLMLNRSELRVLAAAGVEIGAHTKTHPILCALDARSSLEEIHGSRLELEAALDRPVTLFAYPNGKPGVDYDDRHRAMVRSAGFSAAFSTIAEVCTPSSDRWALPRFTPWAASANGFRSRMWLQHWRARRGGASAARLAAETRPRPIEVPQGHATGVGGERQDP